MSDLPDEADGLSSLPLFADDPSEFGDTPARFQHPGTTTLTHSHPNQAAAARFGTVNHTAQRSATSPGPAAVDWTLVRELRDEASSRLAKSFTGDASDEFRQEKGRAIITELIEERARANYQSGAQAIEAEQDLAREVFNALFRLGRLQWLVDKDEVEDIRITGHDCVEILNADGTSEILDVQVADSDDDLVKLIQFTASRTSGRQWSTSEPILRLRLDNGARLTAISWVTPRPLIVIRRHRIMHATLENLTDRGMLTPLQADFLAAAVRAELSIVVGGPQKGGKTTLTRALCEEIPRHEYVVTIETELELQLDELPHWKGRVGALEARPGQGAMAPDGTRAGGVSLQTLLDNSFRLSAQRLLVGEVRGSEILAMLKAAQSSNGSISTTHADSAEATIDKLITCCMECGPQYSAQFATRTISDAIDLVVQVRREPITDPETGAMSFHRWVSDILLIEQDRGGEIPRGYRTTNIFTTPPGGQAARPDTLPDGLGDRLRQAGYDRDPFERAAVAEQAVAR